MGEARACDCDDFAMVDLDDYEETEGDKYFKVAGEYMPNFAHEDFVGSYELWSPADGADWSGTDWLEWDGDSWEASISLPFPFPWETGDAVVVIRDGTTVTYDSTEGDVFSLVIECGGQLEFVTDDSTLLHVTNLQVQPGGTLVIGAEDDGSGDPGWIGWDPTLNSGAGGLDPDVDAIIEFTSVDYDSNEFIDSPHRWFHPDDIWQFGNGLTSLGTLVVHGAPIRPFVRLAEEPDGGEELVLAGPVDKLYDADTPSNETDDAELQGVEYLLGDPNEDDVRAWRACDELLVPDTRQLHSKFESFQSAVKGDDCASGDNGDWEIIEVDSVNTSTNEIGFTTRHGTASASADTMEYPHAGAYAPTFVRSDFMSPPNETPLALPHVANMTRNVIFRSENPRQLARGHVLLGGRCYVSVRYARFTGLGRTKPTVRLGTGGDGYHDWEAGEGPDDLSDLGASCTPSFDENQVGRYPLHMHHYRGYEQDPDAIYDAGGAFPKADAYDEWWPYEHAFRAANIPWETTRPSWVPAAPSGEDPDMSAGYYYQFDLIGNVVDGGLVDGTYPGPSTDYSGTFVADDAGYERFATDSGALCASSGNYDHYMHRSEQAPGTPVSERLLASSVYSRHRYAPKWGIVVHGAHYGLIQDNVVYNVAGAGITTEEGNESYNVFNRNYVARVARGQAHPEGADAERPYKGSEGSGIWVRGQNNVIVDNVAAGTYTYGLVLRGYRIFAECTLLPKFPGALTAKDPAATAVMDCGIDTSLDPNDPTYDAVPDHDTVEADPTDPSQGQQGCCPLFIDSSYSFDDDLMDAPASGTAKTEAFPVNSATMSLLHWAENESYGPTLHGFGLYSLGQGANEHYWVEKSVVDDHVAWHVAQSGVKQYRADFVEYNNTRIYGDLSALDRASGPYSIPTGFDFHSTYTRRQTDVNGGEVFGMVYGIDAPPNNIVPANLVGGWDVMDDSDTRAQPDTPPVDTALPGGGFPDEITYLRQIWAALCDDDHGDLSDLGYASEAACLAANDPSGSCDVPSIGIPAGEFRVSGMDFWNLTNLVVIPESGQFRPTRRRITFENCAMQLVDITLTNVIPEQALPRYNVWMRHTEAITNDAQNRHCELYDDALILDGCELRSSGTTSNAGFTGLTTVEDSSDEGVSVHYFEQASWHPVSIVGKWNNAALWDNPCAYTGAETNADVAAIGPFYRAIGGEVVGEAHPRTWQDLRIHGVLRPLDGSDPDDASPDWEEGREEDVPKIILGSKQFGHQYTEVGNPTYHEGMVDAIAFWHTGLSAVRYRFRFDWYTHIPLDTSDPVYDEVELRIQGDCAIDASGGPTAWTVTVDGPESFMCARSSLGYVPGASENFRIAARLNAGAWGAFPDDTGAAAYAYVKAPPTSTAFEDYFEDYYDECDGDDFRFEVSDVDCGGGSLADEAICAPEDSGVSGDLSLMTSEIFQPSSIQRLSKAVSVYRTDGAITVAWKTAEAATTTVGIRESGASDWETVINDCRMTNLHSHRFEGVLPGVVYEVRAVSLDTDGTIHHTLHATTGDIEVPAIDADDQNICDTPYDIDGDCKVCCEDLMVIVDYLGYSDIADLSSACAGSVTPIAGDYTDGDVNGDGDVDCTDFALVLTNQDGAGCGCAGGSGCPSCP